jgi:hypothetical protein
VLDRRDERRELGVARPAAGDRQADAEDPECRAVTAAEGDEDLVARVPQVVVVAHVEARDEALARDRVPVVRAFGNQEGAAVVELGQQRRLEERALVRAAEQPLADLLVAVHRADGVVVPRAAVEVRDDDAEAERLGDHAGDLLERSRKVVLASDKGCRIEQAPGAIGAAHRLIIGRFAARDDARFRLGAVPHQGEYGAVLMYLKPESTASVTTTASGPSS